MRGGKSGRLGYNFQQIGVITMTEGTITKVAGPLVIAEGMRNADMFDGVRVSDKHLIGEIIEMHGDKASIQVYEETAGRYFSVHVSPPFN